jgi:hypothetical protein
MPRLDNPRHEAFCQKVAKGESYQSAYASIYKSEGKAAGNSGSRLVDDVGISNRIAELQDAGASDLILTLQETNKFLVDVLRTPPGEIDESSPLCQSYKITEGSREYKLPDKLRAAEMAMKLQGRLRERALIEHTGEIKHTVTVTEAERTSIIDRRRAIRERIFQPSKS